MFKLHEIFVQLILRKIITIVATSCQILRLKCTKFDFGCGSAQTPLGELTALPRSPSWIWGPLRGRGRGWAGEEEGRGREGMEGEVEGREMEGPKLLLNQGPLEPCYLTTNVCSTVEET